MKPIAICSLSFCLLAYPNTSLGNLPVSPCKKSSADLNQCIINAWEALRPNVGEGIPRLKIPPLDPFSLPRLAMNRSSDTLDLKAILMPLIISGATNVIVSKLNVDLSDLSGSVSMEFANLNVTTLYDLDAVLMQSMPMKGEGACNATISDLKLNITGKAGLTPKDENGYSFLKLTQVKLKVHIGDAIGRLEDNGKDEDMLTEAANQFYENNRRDMLEVFTPIVEELGETLITDLGDQVLSTVPFEQMFID